MNGPFVDSVRVMTALASVPVVVRVDGAAPAVPPPGSYRHPYGSLPVTGIGLAILLLALVVLGVGAVLVRAAR